MYLKRFQSRPGWIHRYDLLVPNAQYPVWTEKPLDRVASANDLYTSVKDGQEDDAHEKWLNTEFETPAEGALQRAVSGSPMTKGDWHRLVRFIAAQDVRTPVRLLEELKRWKTDGPKMMEETLYELVEKMKSAQEGSIEPAQERPVRSDFPVRVHIRPSETNAEMAELRVETVAGRGVWLWGQRHLLSGVASHLHEHRWTILVAPDGITWPATDNPVVRLNFHKEGKYDFGGGWGSTGTEIFMPIDPTHLVYTQIGAKRMARGTVLSREHATRLRGLICEHAFRHIFSPRPDEGLVALRPRRVDLERYRQEKAEWEKWSSEQFEAEAQLMRPLPGG